MTIEVDIFDSLMPNIITMLTQLCATGILFFLLYKLAWKPVKEIMAKRSAYEQEKITEADRLKEESLKLNEEANKYIKDARDESKVIIENAKKEANATRKEIIDQANYLANEKMNDAHKAIELEKKQVTKEIHDEIVNVALAATEKLLDGKATSLDDQKAIEDFIKEVGK